MKHKGREGQMKLRRKARREAEAIDPVEAQMRELLKQGREAEVMDLVEARMREFLNLNRSHMEWLCGHIRAIRAEASQGGMSAARRQLLEEMEDNALTVLAMMAQGERLLLKALAVDHPEEEEEEEDR